MSMREMVRVRKERKAGDPGANRHENIISPYAQRGKARTWRDDAVVEPALVVNRDDLAAFERMCAARPLKPPPTRFVERTNAAEVAARKDRNGVA